MLRLPTNYHCFKRHLSTFKVFVKADAPHKEKSTEIHLAIKQNLTMVSQ